MAKHSFEAALEQLESGVPLLSTHIEEDRRLLNSSLYIFGSKLVGYCNSAGAAVLPDPTAVSLRLSARIGSSSCWRATSAPCFSWG
jgi:hypothetical protein